MGKSDVWLASPVFHPPGSAWRVAQVPSRSGFALPSRSTPTCPVCQDPVSHWQLWLVIFSHRVSLASPIVMADPPNVASTALLLFSSLFRMSRHLLQHDGKT